MVLTSLNHEQRVGYGNAISLQIINGSDVPGSAWEFTEKKQVIIERNTKGPRLEFFGGAEIISEFSVISHLLQKDKLITAFRVGKFAQQNINNSRKFILTLFV